MAAMKYFQPREFQCQCFKCGKGFEQMQPELIERLEMARMLSNVPYRLVSAMRCEKRNTAVGGVNGSAHTTGWAVDIEIKSATQRKHVLYGLIKAGFNRIGIYQAFIHADMDPTKPKDVIWAGQY
jgi:zinc D-Ala-D-Ala carboxypeptidase